ncbi:MAG: single-stranded DNA-binding protein [Anaerolineales bacterium]
MYHKITLIGNLGRDPEMRYTPSGQAVTNFSMATTEKWTGQDGQPQERTLWWRVSAFGKMAETVNTYLKKGSKVYVEGRVSGDPKTGGPRIYTRQDGTTGASFEVTASTVKFLSSRGEGGAAPAGGMADGEQQHPVEDVGEDIPF